MRTDPSKEAAAKALPSGERVKHLTVSVGSFGLLICQHARTRQDQPRSEAGAMRRMLASALRAVLKPFASASARMRVCSVLCDRVI